MKVDETRLAEFVKAAITQLAHLRNESYTGEEHSMVSVCEQRFGAVDKMVEQLGHAAHYSQCTQCSLKVTLLNGTSKEK